MFLNSHTMLGRYLLRSGSFVDSGADMNKSTFTAERISGAFVKSVLGRSSIETDDDIIAVVKKKLEQKNITSHQTMEGVAQVRGMIGDIAT